MDQDDSELQKINKFIHMYLMEMSVCHLISTQYNTGMNVLL